MLHLIPAPLHRRLYQLAHWARRNWWRVRKPRRSAAIVLAHDGEGRVLLVRHSYGGSRWMLPGGGLARGEEPMAGALREFREELRCALENLYPLETEEERVAGARELQHVFVARLAGHPVPDMREIVEAQLFAADELPPDVGRITAARIERWRVQAG